MAQKKHFSIGGMEFKIEELCIAQDEHLSAIFAELDITGLLDMNVEPFLKKISEKKLLRRLLAIILIPVNSEFDEEKIEEIEGQTVKIKNSQVEAIVQDFLLRNASWLKKARSFLEKQKPQIEKTIQQKAAYLQTKKLNTQN
jgi:hypothetical protein